MVANAAPVAKRDIFIEFIITDPEIGRKCIRAGLANAQLNDYNAIFMPSLSVKITDLAG